MSLIIATELCIIAALFDVLNVDVVCVLYMYFKSKDIELLFSCFTWGFIDVKDFILCTMIKLSLNLCTNTFQMCSAIHQQGLS